MIYALGMNGDIEKAKLMFFAVARKSEIVADDRTYILIINACCHCGDVEMALEIWRAHIPKDEVRFNAHIVSNIAQCLSQQGRIEEATQIIEMHKAQDVSPPGS